MLIVVMFVCLVLVALYLAVPAFQDTVKLLWADLVALFEDDTK